LKFGPVLKAFCDWLKYVFQAVVFGLQPVCVSGSHDWPVAS
jgi:hypothetical protein